MNVTGPVDLAARQTKALLFQPFSLPRWFSFGVIAFLASLGGGGGGGSFNVRWPGSGSPGKGGGSGAEVVRMLDDAIRWIQANLGLAIGIGLGALLFFVALAALLGWLGARGHLMLVRAVATGDPAVGAAWTDVRDPAWSLFVFRFAFGLAIGLVDLALLAWGALSIVDVVATGTTDPWAYVLAALPAVIVLFVVNLTIALPVHFLANNFLVPILYRFRQGLRESWRHVGRIVRDDPGSVLLLVLVKFVIGAVFAIAATIVVTCTCCVGGLPVLHQTILAPLFVFSQAYTLYVVESIGPDYVLIARREQPPPWANWPQAPPP